MPSPSTQHTAGREILLFSANDFFDLEISALSEPEKTRKNNTIVEEKCQLC